MSRQSGTARIPNFSLSRIQAGRIPSTSLSALWWRQRLYNLSDDQTEYKINDRMSFMRFLGINLCDKVPDHQSGI